MNAEPGHSPNDPKLSDQAARESAENSESAERGAGSLERMVRRCGPLDFGSDIESAELLLHRLKNRVPMLESVLLRVLGSEEAFVAQLLLWEIQKTEQEHAGSCELSAPPLRFESSPCLRLTEERNYLEQSLLPQLPAESPTARAIRAFLAGQSA